MKTSKALAVVLAVFMAMATGGCILANRSWQKLAESNGFEGPVNQAEDRGEGQLVLVVSYGGCRIHILTHKPWYEDYTVTYLPENPKLSQVEVATATKLSQLPTEYDLAVCATATLTR